MGLDDSIHVKIDSEAKGKLLLLAEKEERELSSFVRYILTRFTKMERNALIVLYEILRTGDDKKQAQNFAERLIVHEKEIDRMIAEGIKNFFARSKHD